MTETDEEQQAFPDGILNQDGMTLQDYFAAKAMQSLLSRLDIDEVPTTGSNQFTSICLISYFVATEMMKAREA